MNLDFKAIAAKHNIAQVAHAHLKLTPENGQYRAACPACNERGSRDIVITPSKGLWYCFVAKRGGDVIGLLAHIKQIPMREAALLLTDEPKEEKKDKFTGLDSVHEHLEPVHELVQALGFTDVVARALGIGYCKKGLMQGKVCIPIRNEQGLLTGYIGITEAKLPSKWRLT